MSTNENLDPRGAVAQAAAEEPAMLEPEVIVEQIRALIAKIPGFGQMPVSMRKALRGAASAHPAFLQAAINAVGASDLVQQAVGQSPDQLRRKMDDADRWSAVEAEARVLLKGVIAANLARRHDAGTAALQAYMISRQLVRREEHHDLLPHVEEMKRLNRFGRRRRGAPAPAPAPSPVPQQQPQ